MNIRKVDYEVCKKCQYYFGELDSCMYGEPDVPDDMERKCDSTHTNHAKINKGE